MREYQGGYGLEDSDPAARLGSSWVHWRWGGKGEDLNSLHFPSQVRDSRKVPKRFPLGQGEKKERAGRPGRLSLKELLFYNYCNPPPQRCRRAPSGFEYENKPLIYVGDKSLGRILGKKWREGTKGIYSGQDLGHLSIYIFGVRNNQEPECRKWEALECGSRKTSPFPNSW